ncbi:MAG: hypothetical protein LBI56_00110 [Puniceicoccales bacterium]|jgi:tetratricopeptide (TPR) repeat protein|nr:hypothetical protein [Puniceicoccales bacterium]
MNTNGDDEDANSLSTSNEEFGAHAVIGAGEMWLIRLQCVRRALPFIGLLVVSLVLLFFFGQLYENHRSSAMQKAYVQLQTRADRISFIEKYKNHKLAGIVSLMLGDDYLESGDYKLAELEYERAAKILKSTIVFPRTEMSRAVAIYKLGNVEKSEKLISGIIHSRNYDKIYRGNAAYLMVQMMLDCKNFEKLDPFLGNIDSLDLSPRFVALIRSIAHSDETRQE